MSESIKHQKMGWAHRNFLGPKVTSSNLACFVESNGPTLNVLFSQKTAKASCSHGHLYSLTRRVRHQLLFMFISPLPSNYLELEKR